MTCDTNIISVECRDEPIQKVIVFNDRAEIKRIIKTQLKKGINQVVVKNVSDHVMNDSIRVDGRGDAIIHEVQLEHKVVHRENKESAKVTALREEISEKTKELHGHQDKQTVLETRIRVLDSVIDQIGSGVVVPPKEGNNVSFIFDDSTLSSLTTLFGFYDDKSMDVRNEKRTIDLNVESTQRELNVLNEKLNTAISEDNGFYYSRIVSVILDSKEGGDVELDLIYQVSNASWRPSYDLRATTNGTKSLKITYYGCVQQNTGEDWIDALLVLSTAQPCLGGQIPELGHLEAIFYKPPPPAPAPIAYGGYGGGEGGGYGGARNMYSDSAAVEYAMMDSMPLATVAVAHIQEHALSHEFLIVKKSSIPSDNVEHKVTIGIADLLPQLVHECVPSKNTSTFLTASAVNTSEYPFIQGDAKVYLNNSFVANTNMKAVSPGERFACSLGVDTAIRIEYKPVKKYHEQVGIINKSSSTVYEQIIKVKNTRGDSILLVVKENIPRSTDEKIKIRVISPPSVSPYDSSRDHSDDAPHLAREGTKMTSLNNLEWTVSVKGGNTTDLLLKYAIDHPKEEKIQLVEKY